MPDQFWNFSSTECTNSVWIKVNGACINAANVEKFYIDIREGKYIIGIRLYGSKYLDDTLKNTFTSREEAEKFLDEFVKKIGVIIET